MNACSSATVLGAQWPPVDLTQLHNVTGGSTTFVETARYDGIAGAHNIVINEASGYVYAVGSSGGGETCGCGLHMINIQDPTTPQFVGVSPIRPRATLAPVQS